MSGLRRSPYTIPSQAWKKFPDYKQTKLKFQTWGGVPESFGEGSHPGRPAFNWLAYEDYCNGKIDAYGVSVVKVKTEKHVHTPWCNCWNYDEK